AEDPRRGRARGARRSAPQRALGRPAAARRGRPRDRHPARDRARRRAHRKPRQPDRTRSDRADAAPQPGARRDLPVRDPRPEGARRRTARGPHGGWADREGRAPVIALLAALWASAGHAADPPTLEVGGDVKSFFVAVFPYESALLPPDPFGQGVAHGRLKLDLRWSVFHLQAHHAITAM